MAKYAGVDLSAWQEQVDYKALKNGKICGAKVKFVMLRASIGLNKDVLFDKHYKGCKAVGLYVGAYHYLKAQTVAAAEQEARFLVGVLRDYDIDYPVALDFEDPDTLALGLSKAEYTAIVDAFMSILQRANYYVILYAGKYVIANNLDKSVLGRYDLWLAQYTTDGYQAQLGQTMWQYSVAGHDSWDYAKVGAVPGVPGQCDVDWAYIGYAKKIKELGKNHFIKQVKVTATKTVKEADVAALKQEFKTRGFTVNTKEVT